MLVRPKTVPDYVKLANGKATILLPESCKAAAPTTGIVSALGENLACDPDCRLKIGQEVLFSMYSGIEVRFREGDDKGNMYMILNYEDVLGVLQEDMELVPEEVPQGHWNKPSNK